MKLAQSETLRETCRELFLQGFTFIRISEQTGVKHDTVRTWASRFKWKADKARALQTVSSVMRATVQNAKEQAETEIETISTELRLELAKKLKHQVSQLDTIKPVNNVGQGRAGVSKTLTEASAVVFGWKEQPPEQHVHFHSLGARPANNQPVIDVPSVETPQEPKE